MKLLDQYGLDGRDKKPESDGQENYRKISEDEEVMVFLSCLT